MDNATKEYSSEPLCVCVCVCPCLLCVCFCKTKRNPSKNMKLESIVVHMKTDKFDIEHQGPLTTIQTVRS